ncbi:MAG: PAS domain S-box protein, partial [Terriglobales bacterium]
LWKAASALDRLDTSRADLQAYAREISDLYHHAPCGYHSLDAEGKFVKINDTELAWLGYKREEVIGVMGFGDLLVPASRAQFERHFPQVQGNGAVPELEVEMLRKDGSILPAVVSATAIRDSTGKFLRTRSTLFDTTQRKQAEAALRMSEARNRAILASAADAIVTLDEGGAIVEFNPSAEWMFGIRRSIAIEMMVADLMEEDSPMSALSMAELAGELDAAAPRHREFTARRADGSLFPAELTLTRVAGLTPGLFTAFIRDLTQRKRAEADLRTSEERLRLLLDSTGEGIYALDLEGKCILCNPAAVRLLGFEDADDLLGRSIHNLIHHTRADGTPYPANECKSYLSARQGIGIEVDDEVFWRKDGSSFPVEYRSYPVERNGAAVGLVVTFTDITTRRGLEDQIRQSQKMEAVGRLAAGIAHDFNNLLTVINGYSDMLLENDLGDDASDKLRSVRTAGDRAATLTHQLLAFSRQQVLQPRMLDLNAAVRALEPLLRRSIGEDIELRTELAADLEPIKADPSQLDQVLMNLVVNARDAMPEGGTLRIETANVSLDEAFVRPHPGLSEGDYALLTVSDTGTGMRPETQAHIFEPFFTTKPQGKGTGLGLPTVFGIARQSGGTILVDSEWGRGTRMQVFLPVFNRAAASPRPARLPLVAAAIAEDHAPGGRETILVVEGEDELRHLLLEVLHARGYTVIDASRPDQALALAQEYAGGIHLLITNVVMPTMNGQALAQRVRQQRSAIRVLYISSETEITAVPTPFLQKPFAPEALAHAVRQLLD